MGFNQKKWNLHDTILFSDNTAITALFSQQVTVYQSLFIQHGLTKCLSAKWVSTKRNGTSMTLFFYVQDNTATTPSFRQQLTVYQSLYIQRGLAKYLSTKWVSTKRNGSSMTLFFLCLGQYSDYSIIQSAGKSLSVSIYAAGVGQMSVSKMGFNQKKWNLHDTIFSMFRTIQRLLHYLVIS